MDFISIAKLPVVKTQAKKMAGKTGTATQHNNLPLKGVLAGDMVRSCGSKIL
jgi:hypothetical protein